MTLKLPVVRDPEVQRALDIIAQQFPLQPQNVAQSLKEDDVEAVEKLKTIRGIVKTNEPGTIVEGSGFTITRNGTGTVTVNFTAEFSDVPAVTLGAVSGAFGRGASISEVTKAKVKIAVFKVSPIEEIDGEFHFNAEGPR